jgi:endonuclease/exonuclease/phosphatase (EEP) superfamily protein YafD
MEKTASSIGKLPAASLLMPPPELPYPQIEKRPTLVRRVAHPLGAFVCLATLLPVFRSNRWWVRLFDFPRVQVATLGAAAVVAGRMTRRKTDRFDPLLDGLVPAAVVAQLAHIYRFTPGFPKQVISTKISTNGDSLSLLTSNVLMSNRNPAALQDVIARCRPDVVLLLETDQWWEDQLDHVDRHYPYSVKCPINNTYGMHLYSKLPLIEPEVRFLIHSDVPSIRTQIRLPSGREIHFYGMHPKPPGRPNRKGEIRGSAPRDAELVQIAYEIRNLDVPVIVAGDFNDVAWSHTTRRFQRISRVLDPRIGRGLFNSFHASYPWLRFPLDHLFHSRHFALMDFARQPHIGSDHFPIYATLSLEPEAKREQEPPEADASDLKEATEDLHAPEAEQP